MSERLRSRFTSDGTDVLLETNITNVVNRMKAIIDEYYDADISVLRSLQKAEFSKNPIYKMGWEKAKEKFFLKRKDPHLTAVQQPQFPDEYHIALICYSLDFPGVYEEFNRKTRSVKQKKDLDNYNYKSFFIFLMKSISEMSGSPNVYPGVVYRGCSTKFGNATPGKYIIFQQFTSTSSDESIAEDFSQGGTLFEIRGYIKHSTGMNHHSIYPGENEFVIWPFEYFQIIHVKQEKGYTRITLKA